MKGATHWYFGEFEEARPHLEQALDIFDPERDTDLAFQFGQDAAVSAMFYLALTLWSLGDVDRARATIDKMSARGARLDHIGTSANSLSYGVIFEFLRGDAEGALERGKGLAELAKRDGIPTFTRLVMIVMVEAVLECRSGAYENGLAKMRRALEIMRDQNTAYFGSFAARVIAQMELENTDLAAARKTLEAALVESERTGHRWYDSEIHRTLGEILVNQNPADPATAEAAFLTAIAVAQSQKARSLELRAALSLAKLYRSTDREADAYAALGPVLESFSPTPELPEIAKAWELFETLGETDEVRSAASSRKRLVDLQVSYGSALLFDRGHAAPETTSAFERARDLATGLSAAERISVTYGLWIGSFMRGELGPMRELAKTALQDCVGRPNSAEACVAHRINCGTAWFAGEFVEAQGHFERATAILDSASDDELDVRFGVGQDVRVSAMVQGALALWALGEVERARQCLDTAISRAGEFGHLPTIVLGHSMAALFEMVARNPARVRRHIEKYFGIARDNEMKMWTTAAVRAEAWLSWHFGDRKDCLTMYRRGSALWREHGFRLYDPLFIAMQAEIEAESGEFANALATLDRALVESEQTGQRWFDAELHRARGETLLKQNPADAAPAEAAFLTAIAVAQSQKARSFELRATLSLAKLYRATARDADAHVALGPALEGFSPTPEFAEIAEARALFDALAETDAVKTASASQKQRVRLHLALGNALIHSRGYAAPETMAAFARARERAAGVGETSDRVSITFGQWVGCLIRADLVSMRELTAVLLAAVAGQPESPEAGVAYRVRGATHWFEGEYVEARDQLDRALALFKSGRDDDLAFRFSHDVGVAVMSDLALTLWPLGEVDRARRVVAEMNERVAGLTHIGTVTVGLFQAAIFEIMRRDFARAAAHAQALVAIVQERDLQTWRTMAAFFDGWTIWRSGERDLGLSRMRGALDGARYKGFSPYSFVFATAIAEATAETGEYVAALAGLDAVIAESEALGCGNFRAEAFRTRGEILLAQNPSDPAPAEASFLFAIAIAQQQKTRSFELRATLALAKLYRATGRDADAHAALAPALEGFAPTPEFPEIAEARALLVAVGADACL
jgi:predicted ATPase